MFSKHEEITANCPRALLFVILLFLCFSTGCWQSADWVSLGQLWSHVSFNHWCLSERPPKSSDWRGGDLQRCGFIFYGMDKSRYTHCCCQAWGFGLLAWFLDIKSCLDCHGSALCWCFLSSRGFCFCLPHITIPGKTSDVWSCGDSSFSFPLKAGLVSFGLWLMGSIWQSQPRTGSRRSGMPAPRSLTSRWCRVTEHSCAFSLIAYVVSSSSKLWVQ